MIALIVAYNQDRVIGYKGDVPWKGKMRRDMKWFQDHTEGHTVVMGRKTWDSLDEKFKPLPGRRNVVVTRNPDFNPGFSDVVVYHELEDALWLEQGPQRDRLVFVVGGEVIYRSAYGNIKHPVERMYITEITTEPIPGDTFFLAENQRFNPSCWRETFREEHEPDEKNLYPYTFIIYERR